jgi:hypothetical protein
VIGIALLASKTGQQYPDMKIQWKGWATAEIRLFTARVTFFPMLPLLLAASVALVAFSYVTAAALSAFTRMLGNISSTSSLASAETARPGEMLAGLGTIVSSE